MSDESSMFDGASSDESVFAPEPVKAKPAKKKAEPKKATTKTTAAPKKTAAKKRTAPASDNDSDDGDLANTPPSAKKQKKAPAPKPASKASTKPLKPRPNEMELDSDDLDIEETAQKELDDVTTAAKKKNSSEQYTKLTQLEHILKRPDTYVGSIEKTEKAMWVYDSATSMMAWKTITLVPGLYKIFDEILVNAADNKIRDATMDTLKVTIDREKNEISVFNNGRGIPIELHEKEKIWIPELIFGHLLTSSNYDDEEKKVTGGRNGFGAKLCNIFSTEFTVETADKGTKQKYKQTWKNNMSKMEKPKITSNAKGEEYTKITFKPDLEKFQMTELDDDLESVFKRRVYDLAGTIRNVKVFLNGERITKIRNFKQYCEMYVKALREENDGDEKMEIIHQTVGDRWEIAFAVSGGTFQQVSFVNSIATTSGGTHVNAVADQLCTKLADTIKKKNKSGAPVKSAQMRNHFFLFVNCLIENPAFTSQTKEQMTTKPSAFGSKISVPDDFIKKVQKTEVISNIIAFANLKADKAMKKTDGSRRTRINNPDLTDANKAGTKDSSRCILILTEGLSASSLAKGGIAAIGGHDIYGIFPLRGKVLNVREASHDQIMKNAEIQNLKQILGLQHKKIYETTKDLRYGHIMIMTDQDHDGSHIKGLLINLFETQYPSLLRIPNFLIEFITPIVKVFKGDLKKPTKEISFFTMPEYEYWKENNIEKGWKHKYYKGLGTSGEEEAKVYFADLLRHMKYFQTMEPEGSKLIELAFAKTKADERKEWLRLYQPGTYLDHTTERISYPDFINKELILFSIADCARSIPSVVDGLKPGQRKILFACFKRNLKNELKVAQLAGYVSEHTGYQHGEASLQTTIVNMAQNFVGSNNINVLEPSGNFGSRLQGGKDAASARYIYTYLSGFARKLLPQADEQLLTYNMDDDQKIEPNWYVPVVPLILLNGAEGIGTGWSTSIPNYNPEDVVANIRRLMNNEEMEPMTPWYRHWNGTVEKLSETKFKFTGTVRQIDNTHLEVTELPIKTWTQDFKNKLEEVIKAEKTSSFIKDYLDYNSLRRVNFQITMESEKAMEQALAEGLENKFKLSKTITTTNLVAFDPEGRITRYNSVEDIMKEFYFIRLKYYQARKDAMLEVLNTQLRKLTNQARFIHMIIKKELVVSGRKRKELIADLQKKRFEPFSKKKEAKLAGETEPTLEDEEGSEEEEEDKKKEVNVGDGYNYLLEMAIWSLTRERADKMLKDVGDKEEEIDILIKKSPKDLWNEDLDVFIDEWRHQLEEDQRLENTVVKAKGRGKLAKVTKGKGKKKNDDSDSEGEGWTPSKAKKKAVPAKKQSILNFKPDPKTAEKKVAARAATKKPVIVEELSDSDFGMLAEKAKKPEPKPEVNRDAQQPKKEETKKPAAPPSDLSEDDFAIIGKPKSSAVTNNAKNAKSLTPEPPGAGDDFVTADEDSPSDKDIEKEASDASEFEAPKPKEKKAPPKTKETKLKAANPKESKPKETKVAAKKKEAPKPKPAPKDETSIFDCDESDDSMPKATKPKRTAARKSAIRDLTDDESEESDDDGLGDMSKLVKGISDESTAAARPLFAGSSKPIAAAAKTVMTKKQAKKPSSKVVDLDNDSDDDPMLPVTKKKIASPAKVTVPPKKTLAKKPATKPAPKGKGKKTAPSSDEDEIDIDKMADELLDSDAEDAPAPKTKPAAKPKPTEVEEPSSKGRPARGGRAAAAKVNYKIDMETDEDEESEEAEDDAFSDESD